MKTNPRLHARLKRQSGVGVPQIVEADQREPGALHGPLKAIAHRVRVDRPPVFLREYEAVILPRRAPRQPLG